MDKKGFRKLQFVQYIWFIKNGAKNRSPLDRSKLRRKALKEALEYYASDPEDFQEIYDLAVPGSSMQKLARKCFLDELWN